MPQHAHTTLVADVYWPFALCQGNDSLQMPVQRSAIFLLLLLFFFFFFYPFHSLENHGKEKLRNVLEAHRQVQLGLEAKPALQQMASPPGRVSSKQRGPRESRPCPQGARSLVGEARKTTVGCRDF